MAADFKSHVLRRDEKGFLGVPFKRLLLAGVTGGMTFTLLNLAVPLSAIPLAAMAAIGTVVLTSPRGGIALWLRWIYRLRGSLLLMAIRYPNSLVARIVTGLELPVDLVVLDGDRLFLPPSQEIMVDLREWITFAHARERDGLVFVDSPLAGQSEVR